MLSIIIPTYNEADTITELVRRLSTACKALPTEMEMIIVDDNSPDGTAEIAQRLAEQHPLRVIRRPGKGGLASAVIDGFTVAQGDVLVVMDADLSHPPEAVPALVRAMDDGGADLAIGSRYVTGGVIEDWPLRRRIVSRVAIVLTRWLTPVKDATSGFFGVRRSAIEGVSLNPIGFKIGLEVMARAIYRRYLEVPYAFTDRKGGSSKFGHHEVTAFLTQLWILHRDKLVGFVNGRRLRTAAEGSKSALPRDR